MQSHTFQQKLSIFEQQIKYLITSEFIDISPYESIYSDLLMEEYILKSNIDNLSDNVVPQASHKIESIDSEILVIEEKKLKLDAMIKSFKSLSNELDLKMEVKI